MASAPHTPVLTRPRVAALGFDGGDAASFLHNQVSTDVEAMAVGAARWTSYNSPKGRMLATLLLWRRSADGFAAFVASDLAEALRKRLSMFVLRANVKVADLAGVVLGVGGPGAQLAVEDAFGRAPEPGHGAALEAADVVATPDGRYLVRIAPERVDAVRARLALPEAPHDRWDWLGIRAGVPWVANATQDLFVAQTANYDLVGGIDFRKGCYPGQEIIARVQYLGRLKERLFAFHVDGDPPAPGSRLLAGSEAIGTVVNAAAAPEGGSDLLAVVSWAAAAAGGLRTSEGSALTPLALPYAVPEPAAPSRVKL
ncbi:MAG TPA: folate-binding protein [Casimicrobiaceae bacterium]|nr:folate-binding protein [Casimicrobiaceae bacterium]